MNFELGDFRISIVSGGRFKLDGGSMFGVVPKPLWERVAPADEFNRIQLATNCVVVRTANKTVLIDTGFGNRLSTKEREHNAIPTAPGLLENLQAIDVHPDSIDIVVFSHLHFDHAGGATIEDTEGRIRPAFPNARCAAQKIEWDDATSTLPELAGTYLERDIQPLIDAGVDWRLDGATEILPGISVELTGAHTPGHQLVRLHSRGQKAVFLGDLCPTANHLRTFFTMGYDQFPRETRRLKPLVLKECADSSSIVLFDHDPDRPAVRIARDPKREFRVVEQEFA